VWLAPEDDRQGFPVVEEVLLFVVAELYPDLPAAEPERERELFPVARQGRARTTAARRNRGRRRTRRRVLTTRATALADSAGRPPGRLPQRDFDLGRGFTRLPSGRAPPSATAVLLTPRRPPGGLAARREALYRLLLHAASQWVFASLYTQPLENAATRDLVRSQLALPGHPQMLLQLGPATTASPTARRLPGEPDSP
jgi:hypothetical protein